MTTAIGDNVVAVARRFNFVRETQGPNKGLWVTFIQRFTGNEPGDSWCMSFGCLVLNIAYGYDPFRKSGACQDIYDQARVKGLVVPQPEIGCLYFYVNEHNHAHHVGFITDPVKLVGIAGNTSPDGRSSNGDGVYEHWIGTAVYARLPQPKP